MQNKGVRFWSSEILSYCILAISTVIVFITINILFRPAYIKLCERNIDVSIVATAEYNKQALANNVRVTHITVNGRDIDLSNIIIPDTSKWAYDSKNDFLYAYNLNRKETIEIPLKNVHSFSATMVQEEGSGEIEIWLGNGLWQKMDLYKETDWEEISVSYDINKFVFFENHLSVLIIVFVIAFIIWIMLYYTNTLRRRNKFVNVAINITALFVLSALVLLSALTIQYRRYAQVVHYIEMQPLLFFRSLILVFLLMQLLYVLSERFWIAYAVVALVCLPVNIISNIKLLNRAVPLLPWDISLAGEAISIVSGYQLFIERIDIISFGVVFISVLALYAYDMKKNGVKPNVRPVLRTSSVFYLLFIAAFLETSFISVEAEGNYTEYRGYQINNYYNQRGFLPAFLEYCRYLKMTDKPEGYSEANMRVIADQFEASVVMNEKNTPNIIAIMDESFWNAERLDTVKFSEELLPNYNSLKSESMYGELFTHVLNGGTVTSEFEFLTGFSGEFFPQDYMVYGSYIYNGFPSVVSVLEQQGYTTTAIHPYVATNYNRENAYQKLGFDKCIFESDFEDAKIVRGYISDQSTFEKIISEYEANKDEQSPQFIFAVTMQNHGGYWEEQTYNESTIPYVTKEYGEIAKGCMNDYFAGLHESDRVLGELIDHFRDSKENVIIIFFGDHMSNAGPKDDRIFSKTSWNSSLLVYDYETHIVPFLVWSNFEQQDKNCGIMEIGELLPTVFQEYKMNSPGFWNFLISLKDYYAASDTQLVINPDGRYLSRSQMTEDQNKAYETYRLLQYDCIWGEHYAFNLWETGEW